MTSERRRILVVDDMPASVRLLSAVLEAEGHEVISAVDGNDALAKVAAEQPDLVMLDWKMPGKDGFEVCKELRADPATALLPIVMLTSAGADERARALDAGADDFLPKPFDRAELLARVRSLLRIKTYHDTIVDQAAELARWNEQLETRVSTQVAELERLSRLRRFLSPQVADLIVSAGEDWLFDTHRNEIAVLFCDLRGFTGFARTAEPEDVMGVLKHFHEMVGALVREYEATVGTFTGDGIMVFFNDPVPCEGPALRAVSMALDLQPGAAAMCAQWRETGHEIGLGVGVSFGYATLGVMGFDECVEYGPVGTIVNLAARLCAEAASGEVLVSQPVRAAIDASVATEPAGQFDLKGLGPIPTWRVVGVRDAAAAITPAPPVAPVSQPALEGNALVRDGDDWLAAFSGTVVRLRDAKGLTYLARLLAAPGREFHVGDLAAVTDRPARSGLTASSEGLGVRAGLGDAGEVLDETAKRQYQARLAELETEREEAIVRGDVPATASAEDEIDFLTRELAAAFGLGGRPRRAADIDERVRKAVTNRIRETVAKIDRVHPALGRHLSNAVRTGTYCSYAPETATEWNV